MAKMPARGAANQGVPTRSRRKLPGFVPPALLVLAGLLAYGNSFDAPFIFDDNNAILDNPHVRSLWPLSEAMGAPDQSTVAGRPVVALSLAVNYAVSGLDPWSYHAFNLVVHLLNGLILYGLLWRTLRTPRFTGRPPGRRDRPRDRWALAASLLWLVHPLATEAVTYVSTRTESLMAFFYLGSLYAFVRGTSSRTPVRWYAISLVACALAMGSKEVAVTAPVVVFIYDAVFVARGGREAIRRRWGFHAGLAATWLLLAILVGSGPRSETAGFGLATVAPLEYARTQVDVVVHYLRLALWPRPLVLDYGWPLAEGWTALRLVRALLLLALAGFSVWGLIRRSWLGFLGGWFFLILAPSSSIIPVATEVAAERRMYLPLIAVIVILALGIRWLFLRLARNRAAPLLIVATVLATAGLIRLTHARNDLYRSEISIWEETVRLRPDNARAHENLGSALARAGRRGEAADGFRRALDLDPDSYRALENLGLTQLEEGRADEAVGLLSRAATLRPRDGTTRLNLAGALMAAGRPAAAMDELKAASRLLPESGLPHARMGTILAQAGRMDDAEAAAREAVAREPQSVVVRVAAGSIFLARGDAHNAVVQLEAALRLDPGNPEVRQVLAQARAAASAGSRSSRQ